MSGRADTSARAMMIGAVLGVLGALPFVLGGCSKKEPSAEVAREMAQREAFAHELVIDAGASRAWFMSSRSDVLFEEGFSALTFDPDRDMKGHPFRWMGANNHVRLKGHGGHAMRLFVHGWTDYNAIKTHPIVSIYIDGRHFGSVQVTEDNLWGITTIVPADVLTRPWVDLTISLSSIAFHWLDAPYLKVAVLNGLEWTEEP